MVRPMLAQAGTRMAAHHASAPPDRYGRRFDDIALIWLRYGSDYAAAPLNCLYSACRGLLVDGHRPELCLPPENQRAARGFFCLEDDEGAVRAVAFSVERVVANPRGRFYEPQEVLAAAMQHHRMGVAHVWLTSDIQ